MVNIETLFGEEFLSFIEEQQAQGKSLGDIAAETGKTYEAIRSKVKREKQKCKKGIVTKSTSNTPVENIEKPIKNTNKTNIKSKVDIDTLNIESKLDFIISLIENSNQKEEIVQVVGQTLQIDVQHKKDYVKTSMRVEKDVWKEFLEFAKNKNTKYKQQDLISLALKEFLQTYKKK